eukprot:11632_1
MMASNSTIPIATKHVVHTGENCGHNTWSIHNKKLVQQILSAKVGELFESKPFKMAQMLWTIRLYPNGNNNNSKGSVKIFLKLVSMPHVLEQIILSYTTSCPLSMASSTALDIYLKSGDSKGWLNRSLLLNEWKQMKPNMIQIIVSVNIFKVKFKKYAVNGILSHYRFNQNETFSIYPKKQKLIYKIDNYTLNKFKQSYYGKRYESAIFNHMWRLRWFPNGANHDCATFMSIYLVLCRIPFKITQLTTKYRITCKELNRSISAVDDFSFAASNWGKSKFIALQDIEHLNSLTFIVDIEILNEIASDRDDCDIWDETQIKYVLGMKHNESTGMTQDKDHEYGIVAMDIMDMNQLHTTENMNQLAVTQAGAPSPRHSTKSLQISNGLVLKKDIKSLKKRMANKEKTIEQLLEKMNVFKCGLKEEIKKRKHMIKLIHNKMKDMEEYLFSDDEKRQDMDNNYLAAQIVVIRKKLNSMQDQMDGKVAKKLDSSSKKEQVKEWLVNTVELPQYFDHLIMNGFDDLEAVKDLTKEYLEEIGIEKIGHQLKLLRFIRKMNEMNSSSNGGPMDDNVDYNVKIPFNDDDHEFVIMTNGLNINHNQCSIQPSEGGIQQFNTI